MPYDDDDDMTATANADEATYRKEHPGYAARIDAQETHDEKMRQDFNALEPEEQHRRAKIRRQRIAEMRRKAADGNGLRPGHRTWDYG